MLEANRSLEWMAREPSWDQGLQAQVAELNAQLLELLRQRAQSTAADRETPALAGLAPLLMQLAEPALQLLARCPYLMLDAGFSRPACWEGAVHEAPRPRTDSWVAPAMAPDLLRRAVMLGWHLARANPYAARICLGMTPQCANLMARMRLRHLELLVEQQAVPCHMRWEDRPTVWRQLLEAAVAGPAGHLETLQLRGLQLIAAEYRQPG